MVRLYLAKRAKKTIFTGVCECNGNLYAVYVNFDVLESNGNSNLEYCNVHKAKFLGSANIVNCNLDEIELIGANFLFINCVIDKNIYLEPIFEGLKVKLILDNTRVEGKIISSGNNYELILLGNSTVGN